jgi:hypothetical protein
MSSRELADSFVETCRESAGGGTRAAEASLVLLISELAGGANSLSDRDCFFLKRGGSVLKGRLCWRALCCLAQF